MSGAASSGVLPSGCESEFVRFRGKANLLEGRRAGLPVRKAVTFDWWRGEPDSEDVGVRVEGPGCAVGDSGGRTSSLTVEVGERFWEGARRRWGYGESMVSRRAGSRWAGPLLN